MSQNYFAKTLSEVASGRTRGGSSSWTDTTPQWRKLQAAGAPDEEVEKARRLEALYGQTGLLDVAETLNVPVEDQGPTGAVEKFFNYLQRPGSAVVGLVTGLTGMERRTKEGEVEGGSGWREAMDRAAKGISGEEWYRSKEFGALQYDENASTAEKAYKSAIGFALDVALDPLTYVSGPGSILGRVKGASLMDDALRVAVKKPVREGGSSIASRLTDDDSIRIVQKAIESRAVDEGSLMAFLNRHKIDISIADPREKARALAALGDEPVSAFATLDDVLKEAAKTPLSMADGVPVGNALSALAQHSLASGAAAQYATRGYGAARKFLRDAAGEDSAEILWKMLPTDLQGGLRIRMPFIRKAVSDEIGVKVPVTLKVVGGGGRIVEAVAPLRWTRDLSNGARQFLRTAPGFRGVPKSMMGRHGEWFSQMAADVYGKKEAGAVTYARYRSLVDASRQRSIRDAEVNETLGRIAHSVSNEINRGRQAFGEKFLSEDGSTGALQDYLSRLGELSPAEVAALPLVERAAYDTTRRIHGAMDEVVEVIKDVIPDFQRLEAEFFPRVWELFTSYGSGGKGLKGLANQRQAFSAVIGMDGAVLRWFTPAEIKARFGVEIFRENPEQAILSYIMATRKVLNELYMQKELVNRGVLVSANVLKQIPDADAAVKKTVELLNRFGEAAPVLGSFARGSNAEQIALREREMVRLIGEEAFQRGRAASMEQFVGKRALGKMSTEDVTALSAVMSQWGRQVMDLGYESSTSAGSRAVRFLDGRSIVEFAPGQFRIVLKDGKFLTKTGKPTANASSAIVFDNVEKARYVMQAQFKEERDIAFRRLADLTRKQVGLEVANTLDGIKVIRDANGNVVADVLTDVRIAPDMSVSAMAVENIPPAHQEQYFEGLIEILQKYGVKDPLRTNAVNKERYLDLMEREFAPIGPGSTVRMVPTVQKRMAEANLFAPSTVIDAVNRIFRARQNPTQFSKWLDDYYMPFYALQKSLMTAQRGPGYVVRNIIGGVWNAYLVGTTKGHFALASSMKAAELEAVKRAKEKHGDDAAIYVLDSLEDEFIKRFGKQRGQYLTRAWTSWEMLGQRGSMGTSQTAGTVASSRLNQFSETAGEYLIDAERGVVRVQELPRGTRVLIWGANENPWARVMRRASNESEDWLRLATFLRGVDEYGIEDGGVAASMFVKASQFDYTDLSDFEATILKNIVPFYTWTRNNVPLQVRAAISEPGRVKRALQINAEAKDVFGEEEELESPLPSFVRERFGWKLRPDILQTAQGDPLTVGMIWGEPMADINRLFRGPSGSGLTGELNRLNWREVVNMLNPIAKVGTEAITGIEASTGGALTRTEQAPGWARPFSRRTPEGEYVASTRLLNIARDLVPPLGQLERLFPRAIGNDRLERRELTQWISTLGGLPVSTLDAFQIKGELAARQRRVEGELERALGQSLPERAQFARDLLEIGVTDDELAILETDVFGGSLNEVPLERLNPTATAATIRFIRRIRALDAQGVPKDILEQMVKNFTPPAEERRPRRRALTVEELEAMGLTPNDITKMSPEELDRLLTDVFGR